MRPRCHQGALPLWPCQHHHGRPRLTPPEKCSAPSSRGTPLLALGAPLLTEVFFHVPGTAPLLRTPAGVHRRLTHPPLSQPLPPSQARCCGTEAPKAGAPQAPSPQHPHLLLRGAGRPHRGVLTRIGRGLHCDLGLLCPESLPTGLPKEEPLAVCSLRVLGQHWG